MTASRDLPPADDASASPMRASIESSSSARRRSSRKPILKARETVESVSN